MKTKKGRFHEAVGGGEQTAGLTPAGAEGGAIKISGP